MTMLHCGKLISIIRYNEKSKTIKNNEYMKITNLNHQSDEN